MTLKEMISHLAELDRAYSEAKAEADRAQRERDAYEYEVHQRMEDEGFDLGDDIKHNGTRWGYQVDWYAKVQDPLAFKTWAEENAEHLIQPKPRMTLLNQLVQEAHDDGAELPPGLAASPKLWVSRRTV